jgi:hypothetical protein
VNVEVSAHLVGKEGLNPKAPPIGSTGLIGILEVGDEKDGFFVIKAPPAYGVERDCWSLRKTDLLQKKGVALVAMDILTPGTNCGFKLELLGSLVRLANDDPTSTYAGDFERNSLSSFQSSNFKMLGRDPDNSQIQS